MPGMYTVRLSDTVANSVTMGGISAPGSGMRRAGIKTLLFSFGAASDTNIRIFGQRSTAAGTSTAVTPQADDPADAASNFVAGENHSVEPTYTAGSVIVDIGLYAKGFYREQLPLGDYYIIPATANNGVGFTTPSPGATPTILIKLGVQQF